MNIRQGYKDIAIMQNKEARMLSMFNQETSK